MPVKKILTGALVLIRAEATRSSEAK